MDDAEEIKLWAVYTNSDLTEGRGRQYVKHFCRSESTAHRLAKRGYVQGSDCPVVPVTAISVNGRHFLPTSMIKIEEPTAEDNAAEERISRYREAIAKAEAAGLSEDDIAILIKGSKP